MIAFYATPKFPSSDFSYDVQIWPLSFAPYLTHLFVPPCTDPSTLPHIQESDVQVTCRHVEGSVHTIKETTEALVLASKETGLEVNADKTKCMVMS